MPVVVEIGIPVGEVKVRDARAGCYEEFPVDEQFFGHSRDDFLRKRAGIREYDLTPILEVACISVLVLKANVHRHPYP